MDKKPNFALLIAGKPKDGKEEQLGMSKDEHEEDLGAEDMDKEGAENSACADIVKAMKSGDHMMLKLALKDFIALQEPDGDEEAPMSDDGKEEDSEGY